MNPAENAFHAEMVQNGCLKFWSGLRKAKGKEGDLELLEELAETIKQTAMCGLGQTAPNPVLSH